MIILEGCYSSFVLCVNEVEKQRKGADKECSMNSVHLNLLVRL